MPRKFVMPVKMNRLLFLVQPRFLDCIIRKTLEIKRQELLIQ